MGVFCLTLCVLLVPLFLPIAAEDACLRFMRAGALGAAAYLFLEPQYTGVRYPLVLLPFAAVGVARAISMWPKLSRPVYQAA
jgi:hypothetical protein